MPAGFTTCFSPSTAAPGHLSANGKKSYPDAAFRPLAVGALYPGIGRGLVADVLAAHAQGGAVSTVCTAHVVAGHGVVTDVLDVPTDTVSAQLEHLFSTGAPSAAKVGIVGHPATVQVVFRRLEEHLHGPLVLDLTLSGPSGEDVVGPRGVEALAEHLGRADLVTLRLRDAELIAGMEIPSLDDAQVAAQRIGSRGARRVLLRCGQLPTHYFDLESPPPAFAVDLFYDGSDFALFEAPYLGALPGVHGASSAFTMALLSHLHAHEPMQSAIQNAKIYVTEALRRRGQAPNPHAPHYFWKHDANAQRREKAEKSQPPEE